MNKLIKILQKPHPLDLNKKKQLKQIAIAGLIVFTFFFVFQPFGLKVEPFNIILKSAFLYGLGTIIISLINNLLVPYFFSNYFNESRWTFGRNILFGIWYWISLTITMIIIGYLIFPNTQVSAGTFLKMFLYVFILGQFIFIVISYLNQSYLTKKHESLSVDIQTKIKSNKADDKSTEIVIPFPFDFDKRIIISEICFIESLGNYLKVFWEDSNGRLQNIVVRKSLTELEKELEGFNYIFKCHRSYVVNTHKIQKVSGDSQGLKLRLKNIEQTIPVSRSKIKEFKNLFANENAARH